MTLEWDTSSPGWPWFFHQVFPQRSWMQWREGPCSRGERGGQIKKMGFSGFQLSQRFENLSVKKVGRTETWTISKILRIYQLESEFEGDGSASLTLFCK